MGSETLSHSFWGHRINDGAVHTAVQALGFLRSARGLTTAVLQRGLSALGILWVHTHTQAPAEVSSLRLVSQDSSSTKITLRLHPGVSSKDTSAHQCELFSLSFPAAPGMGWVTDGQEAILLTSHWENG